MIYSSVRFQMHRWRTIHGGDESVRSENRDRAQFFKQRWQYLLIIFLIIEMELYISDGMPISPLRYLRGRAFRLAGLR